jgi:hypothetical protein
LRAQNARHFGTPLIWALGRAKGRRSGKSIEESENVARVMIFL